ncbi:caprin-2 isoform X2 [Tachyglossus aculeatus]|nr:caprin-2 isoform X2 [Tachyglossus aculeatus]XP_038624537.1 caprin-2 isoform X2 [Tachyglossus aculeatus]XP_038624545.1 caprin-2 isoform X2 [Tachyglossus aculeatus]
MVQLPLSSPGGPCPSKKGEEGSMRPAKPQTNHNPHGESQLASGPLQSALGLAASPSQAYEMYVDNGLLCLKHKIRNIEKKKIKLEDYKDRLKNGESLNPDQLEAVEKYDEVLHHLEFAKELQKTLSGLSQDLLKAQKKAQRREHIIKLEAEKKKLRTIFQVQYVLQNFTQDHVQKDFKEGSNGAVYLPSKELDYLIKFSKLTCPQRNESLSVEDQMEQSSLCFWDLLEGSDKAVVGTTYKHMKDLLSKLLNSGYFESVPIPHPIKEKEGLEELKKKHFSKAESETIVELRQPEIQAQEFLNRRYLPDVEYSTKKPEEPQSWDSAYARKPNLPKSWEALIAPKDPEKNRESSKAWEGTPPGASQAGVAQEPKKQDGVKPRTDHLQEGPQQETLKPKPPQIPEEPQKPELPKSWTAELQGDSKQQPPKPWAAGQKQENPKQWMTPVAEDRARKPETRKLWETDGLKQQQQPPPTSQQLQTPPKSGSATPSFVAKELLVPRKCSAEPKDKRERRPKQDLEVNQVYQPASSEFSSSPTLPKDPVLRREKLQDLMTHIQGTCNFMQESVLDFDKPPPSATAPPQPPSTNPSSPKASREEKLPSSSDFLKQPSQAAGTPVIQGSNVSLSNADQTSSGSETELGSPEIPLAAVSLSNKEPSSLPAPNTSVPAGSQGQQVFQTPPVSSHSVTVNTAPFQAMQTVFNVNAPLPPRKEQETKESPPYSSGNNQSYSTASTQTPSQCQLSPTHVEQAPPSQESLQTVNYHPEGAVQASNGSLAFYPAQTVFPRSNQSFLGGRGTVRGCARGGRSLTNSYRSPGGYKGFDAYRGSPAIANGGYGQLQFPGREFPGTPYPQRDLHFQQGYKRGTSGPRANSRGWGDCSQLSSPDRDGEPYADGEAGPGESRGEAAAAAAALLPVHVYPLPQQMRVAFSAARTSNLAPGTLDQPIVFDLLLNNLGETFDLQLGRFNCPVDGTYVFIFHMLKLAVNVPLYVNLMKNEEVLVSAYANDGAPDHETASNHAILQLFRGDQVWLRLHRGAVYGSSWKYSTFSGYLLYQD